MSPNTIHMRGSTVPLTMAISVPTMISTMSRQSANLNYTYRKCVERPTRRNHYLDVIDASGRLLCVLVRKKLGLLRSYYILTAGDRWSPPKQLEERQHSHPLSPLTSCTDQTLTHTRAHTQCINTLLISPAKHKLGSCIFFLYSY